ncbi:aminodeoxychorismate synthase, component I [Halodesulfurarchaeum formicicum]|uniref:anthranilate synthase n=1 Tax=Halodesulfurarchaeum formicicum TaxID=1873524 RepID=A0A1J1AB11_9EURY|nr:aminodeoxychorismate synthase, component I [Halodesulfurarchaeum formicicum]APE94753.1 para-aminobenzoate synthetase component I [Halodesulfurarchaeum formicicum]
MRPFTVSTTRSAFAERAAGAPDGARVPIVGRLEATPWMAYRRARGSEPSFFFETSGGREGWGYFGVEPTEFLTVDGQGALDRLEATLETEALVETDCEIPYPGGLFGWLSYDVVRELEELPTMAADDRDLPHLQFGVYEAIAAWRMPFEDELFLVASPRVEGDPEAAYDRGRDRLDALATAIQEGDPAVGAPPATAATAAFESRTDRDAYAERVGRVKNYIREGDTFQVNISQRLEAPAAVHPVEAYDALRTVNPAPYSGLLEYPGVDLVSASPELLLEREGDRIETEPIAGTRPRGETEAEDQQLEADLTGDEKERAEHAMLVDLERNDLGKVSEYGTVTVDEYRRVDRYSEVMHLVSLVSGQLREDESVVDAIRAVFPGGTITGAPKPRTMEIIEELEQTRRGPYTGSMAAIGFDGRATLNIVIRTLVRHADQYHLRVGGGIVHDSVPDREYDETLDKARALLNAVDAALDAGALEVEE